MQLPALLVVFGLLLLSSFLVSESGLENITGMFHGAATATACGEVNQSLTLTANVAGNTSTSCFLINSSNLVFSCSGFNITGNSTGIGVNVTSLTNVTVKDCVITNYSKAVLFSDANNSFVLNSTLRNSTTVLHLNSAHNNRIVGNSMNGTGMIVLDLDSSNNNTIANNTVLGIGVGSLVAEPSSSSGNSFINNQFTGFAGINFRLIASADNNTFVNNTFLTNTGTAISMALAVNNTFTNSTVITNTGTAINFAASNNTFINTTIQSNATWIATDLGSLGNNFTDTTFESQNGSIRILPKVNVSNSVTMTQSLLNITFNRALLNSSNLTFFNVSAVIIFKGILLADPVPMADFNDNNAFVNCTSSICIELSFASNTYTFNVTQFTTYSVMENLTISECPRNITTQGLYYLTQSISSGNGTCIMVNASHVSINCSSFIIGGNGTGFGINATGINNITVKNCIIENFTSNILLQRVNSSFLFNNTARNSSSVGIRLISSLRNVLTNNTASSVGGRGFSLETSSNNNLTYNFGNSTSNSGIILISNSNNNSLTNNTAISVSSSALGLSLTADNNTLINNTGISESGIGVIVASSSNNVLIRNRGVSKNSDGIFVSSGTNNSLTNNTGQSTSDAAISIGALTDGRFIDNTAINSFTGIEIFSNSQNIFLTNNNVTNNSNRHYDIANSHVFSTNLLLNPGTSEIDGASNLTMTGNITNLGKLIINFSTILVNVSVSNQFTIENNGTLVTEGANFTSNGTTYLFVNNFRSNLTVQHSFLNFMGINGLDVETNNATVNNNTFFRNSAAVTLFIANNSIVSNNTIINSTGNGIVVNMAYYNVIINNNMTFNVNGINIDTADNNTFINNTILNSTNSDLAMSTARNNTFANNTFIAGIRGIQFSGQVHNNSFFGGIISNSQFGIDIGGGNENNTFKDILIVNNTQGINIISGQRRNAFNGVVLSNSIDLNATASTANNTFVNVTISKGNGTLKFDSVVLNGSAHVINNDTVLIMSQLVAVDSSRAPSFNSSATATLFNVPSVNTSVYFTSIFSNNVQGIVAGEIQCPSSICTSTAYDSSAQTETFTITGFSTFAMGPTIAAAAAAAAETAAGGGGGGGGIAPVCRSNWTCSDWGSCSPEGTQSRKCTNLTRCVSAKPAENRNCTYAPIEGVPTPQPLPEAPEEAAPAEVEKPIAPFNILPYAIAAVAALLLIGGYSTYIVIGKRKKKEEKAVLPEELPAKPKLEAYESRLKELEEYVAHSVSEGLTHDDVKKKLITAGWPEEVVAKAFEGLKALYSDEEEKILRHYLKIGYSKETIEEFLKSKGWKEEKIRHVFDELK